MRALLMIVIVNVVLCFLAVGRLQYVTQIFRHGARYPVNDLYDGNKSIQLQGQLTTVGLRQHYLLGSYLRSDYLNTNNFLSQKLDPKAVQVMSSTTDRAWYSALAHVHGLFAIDKGWEIPSAVTADKLLPPFASAFNDSIKNETNFALKYGFQPVPIRTIDQILDNCPKYGVLFSKRLQEVSKNLTQIQTEQSLFISKMKVVFNLSALQITVPTMSDLYDTLYSDLNLGRQLPKEIDQSDIKRLKYISDYYQSLIFDGNFSNILSTPILSLLKSNMDNVIKQENNVKKLTIISGHFSNLLPMMTTLNLTSAECITQRWKNQTETHLNCMQIPAFGANLIFQLHEDQAFEHTIRIRYNGQYAYLCQKKVTSCSFDEFMDRVEVSFVDFVKICNTG